MVTKVFEVTDGPLSVRSEPGGNFVKQYGNGTRLTVDADSRQESGGYIWWKHSEGWSAEGSTDGRTVFMTVVVEADKETTEAPAATSSATPSTELTTGKVLMQIGSQDVRIRTAPTLSAESAGWVKKETTLEVNMDTQTEADGFLWVQHHSGWSAIRKLDNSIIFMTQAAEQPSQVIAGTSSTTESGSTADLFVAREPQTTEPDDKEKTSEAATPTGTGDTDNSAGSSAAGALSGLGAATAKKLLQKLQAKTGVKVRDRAGLSGKEIPTAFIAAGTVIEFDDSTKVEIDGYIWIQHSTGWSALQNMAGTTIFFVEPGSVSGLVTISADGPDITQLPGYKTMIERLPVDLAQTQWFQYFGNNVFGYTRGKEYNYDGYSQGIHGGLDFGNSSGGTIPIYAGLHCTYSETKNKSPNLQVWAKRDDYIIIWQHIRNVRSFSPGQPITPDTVIAEIEPGFNHLHFEIRYKSLWIVNPLAFMPDDMLGQITGKFNPSSGPGDAGSQLKYFWKTTVWDQWCAPLDQPVIRLAGPIVGPKAGK